MITRMVRRAHGIARRQVRRIGCAVRLAWLHRVYDIEIEAPRFIAPSARFDFECDGFSLGGRVRIQSGLRMSHGAILAPYGGTIAIGRNAFVGPYAILCGHGGLTIGDNVLIAAHTMIIPANHRFEALDLPIVEQGVSAKGIVIGDDVWIGSGVRILDGVRIASGAIIGAGAVVTQSIPSMAVAAGVPARILRYRTGATDASVAHAASGLGNDAVNGHHAGND